MAYDIAPGTPNWDVPLNAALDDIDNRVTTNTTNVAANSANITTLQGQMSSVTATANGALQKSANLSDVTNASTSRANLGLGGAAVLNVGTSTGTVAAGDDSRITNALQNFNNLSDVSTPATARTNLGLGGAATLNVGTTTGTVAAGDDSRITGAAQKASNLSDLASAGTARTNLGLGGAATLNVGTTAGTVAAGNDSRITGALQASNNLSDVAAPVTSAQNIGLVAKATSSAESNATTTLAASTSLVVPVKASATYLLHGNICWTNNTAGNGSTTGGFKHSFTGPAGATLVWADSSGSQLATLGTVDNWSSPSGANSPVSNWISGVLTVSGTAGNLTVTFAAQFSGTVQLLPGSNIQLTRIA